MKAQIEEKPRLLNSSLQGVVVCFLLFSFSLAIAASLFASSALTAHIKPVKARSDPNTTIQNPTRYNSSSSSSDLLLPSSRRSAEFRHCMDDEELLKMAAFIGRRRPRMIAESPTRYEVPKVAFMFLVKGPLHLGEFWDRFFRGNRGLYSIYVHSSPSHNYSFAPGSVFHGTRIPSKEVNWGNFNMVEAERRLLASALLDTSNQRFILLSESCIPLFNFTTIYSYLINSTKNFVEAYDQPGPVGRDRYNRKMHPTINLSQWRKGSQWFQINRNLAQHIVTDRKYFEVFRKHCKNNCYGDEHYLPTFTSIMFWRENANRTLTFVDWSRGGPHPRTFYRPLVTVEFLEKLRSNRSCEYNGESGHLCFLFARKFPVNSLSRLMLFAKKVLQIK